MNAFERAQANYEAMEAPGYWEEDDDYEDEDDDWRIDNWIMDNWEERT